MNNISGKAAANTANEPSDESAGGPSEVDLARAYESEVDPRLNYEQSLELAFLIARKMKRDGRKERISGFRSLSLKLD